MSEEKIFEVSGSKAWLTFTKNRLLYSKAALGAGSIVAGIFGGAIGAMAYEALTKKKTANIKLDLPYNQLEQLIIIKSKWSAIEPAKIAVQPHGTNQPITLRDIELQPKQTEQLIQTLQSIPQLQGKIKIEYV